MQVDYVIPFVDSSDSEWVSAYRKYVPATIRKKGLGLCTMN